VRAEIEGLQQQIASADINRKLIAAELEMNRELFKQAYVQQTRLMIFERALADKDEARGQYNAEHAVAQQKLVELDLKVISLEDEYVKRASDEYSEANRRVLELRERLRPIANALARQVVVAPAAGEVVGLKIHTAGAVISPGEVLMEIVPEQPVLLIEGKARPEDIADLALGQQVDIQVTAFKQRATPLLTGRLAYVSADSMAESINGMSVAYYLIQVAVDEESVKGLPSPLGPGMPATLFIQTRARTALDYLLQPLTDSMQKAFREH
jgi:HlyD family type I secretion membrane fusion protein